MSWTRLLLPCVAGLALVSPAGAQTPATIKPAVAEDAPVAASWIFDGGASFYLLQPYYKNNVAYSTTSATTRDAGRVVSGVTQSQPFGWSMQPAMDFWLSAASPCGIGLRTHYFHFDGASNDATLSVPSSQYNAANSSIIAVSPSPYLFNSPPGTVPQQNPALAGLFGGPSPFVVNYPGAPASVDRFTFQSNLRLDAIDLEFTGAVRTKTLDFIGGLGGRYFHMTQDYSGSLVNLNGLGANLSESLQYNRTFQGGGPTVSGQLSWHPFLPNLSLFAGGRGSLVVGQTSQLTSGSRVLNDPTGAFNPIGVPSSSSNSFRIPYCSGDVLPIAELELGLEYSIFLRTSTVYFRGAVVDQTYFGAGNASRQDGNLSLFGFKATCGFNF